MNFSYDAQRQLLIYPQLSDVALQAIPEARPVNPHGYAIPASLRNSQILRWLNYPVAPVMSQYDWPHAPGITPYESQKTAANFMVLHRRCFNLSDMGCVSGDTKIETDKGPVRIDTLARRGLPIRVKALVAGKIKIVPATTPFAKGMEKLYRVSFASGRTIDVTAKHFFWTCRGWVSCADLVVGERLPKFEDALPASNSEFYLSKSSPNEQHWIQTIPNSHNYFRTPSYDAPLLQDEDIFRALIPSQGDVPERSQLVSRKDAQGTIYKNKDRRHDGPLSTRRYSARDVQDHTEFLVCESTTKQVYNQDHTCEQYHPSSNHAQLARGDQELPNDYDRYPAGKEFSRLQPDVALLGRSHPISWQHARSPNLDLTARAHRRSKKDASLRPVPVDTVTHVAYIKTDVYYDLHVPAHENYIAHGLCHHNTGKTMSTLWAIDWLMTQTRGECRALIVAPLSTLQRVWGDAIFRHFMGRRTFQILHGTAVQRSRALETMADFYIINPDGVGIGAHTRKRFELDGFSRQLAARPDIRIAVVDEASAYKDASTKRHRIARLVFGKKPYLFLLTGTPTPNAPTDAHGLAKLVNNAFGKSRNTLRSETMIQVSNFIWKPQRDGYEKARRLLTPSIRFDIRDVWDGPEMTTQQREVPLTPAQQKMMTDLKRDLQLVVKSGQTVTAANEAAARQKFLQVSAGAVYDASHKAHLIDAAPRLAELRDVIEQAPGKLLLFSGLTSIVELLYRELKDKHECAIVNGNVTQHQRAEIFRAFQDDENPRILIADPGTMAHGLDLWAARTVVWYGPTDKTELYLQANRRAHRPGQKFPVTVVQLVSNKLEIEIFRRLETNTTLQGVLLDLVRKGEL